MSDILSELLCHYVSIRDTATRASAENYYHGFLSALLSGAGNVIRGFQSNAEAGDGYADILFSSSKSPRIGVVIEIKHCAKAVELEKSARHAIDQIQEKRYVQGLAGIGCKRFWGFGIAFSGKSCVVECVALNAH